MTQKNANTTNFRSAKSTGPENWVNGEMNINTVMQIPKKGEVILFWTLKVFGD